MKHLKKYLYTVCCVFILFSCKSAKNISNTGNVEKMSVEEIAKNNKEAQLNFKTLKANLKVEHHNGEKVQNFTIGLRMEKDRKIWMSFKKAGFSGGKALITPEKVLFYNKLDKNYFEGSFSFISNLLGVELNFLQLQNLLLGDPLLNINANEYKVIHHTENGYQLSQEKEQHNIINHVNINNTSFKVNRQEIDDVKFKNFFIFEYLSYQAIHEKALPNEARFISNTKQKKTTTSISYHNISIDNNLKFPFKIPTGYEQISF